MEPVPASLATLAESLDWPSPAPDGTTVMPPETLHQIDQLLTGLVNYIEAQLTLCRVD